ncbi:MAG: GNAT family acetyltransferase [Desulfobacteraceae bacterium]|nr:MAG: GNAT family acetyltransferase [Desulfobacteraceae bacterium]
MRRQIEIVEYDNAVHRNEVKDLWQAVFGYEAAHNAPELVIDKKLQYGDGLFFVACTDNQVVGTVMAGYDGHRGWIYSIAVHPAQRKQGLGSSLLTHAENRLLKVGCLKVNLQIMEGNEAVQQFYVANGFSEEKRVSMGKRLYPESE